MIQTTHNDAPLYLLNEVDFASPLEATFALIGSTEEGLTGREMRRPLSTSLRIALAFSAVVSGPAARKLERALSEITGERVAVPFWPGVQVEGSTTPPVLVGGLNVAFSVDWTSWELFTTMPPGWLIPGDCRAPLVVGILTEKSVEWLNAETAVVSFRFQEASPLDLALVPPPAEFMSGPAPSEAYTSAPKVFTGPLNYIGPEDSFAVNIEREQIGFGRELGQTVYSIPLRGQRTEHFADGAENVARLLRFWADHATGRPFWIPSWHASTELLEDVPDGETILPVADTFAVSVGDWLAFATPGEELRFARVVDNAGGNITLDAAPGFIEAASTVVCRLMLARVTTPRLALSFTRLDFATTRFPVREVPAEYTPPAGEDLGATIGFGYLRAYLYELRQARGDGETVLRLTSHEAEVTVGGETYQPARITHGDLVRGIVLDRDELTVRHFLDATNPDNPLYRLATLRAHTPVRLVVREVELFTTSDSMTNFTLLLNQTAAVDGAAVLTGEMRRFVCYLVAASVTTGATVTVEARMPDNTWAPVHVEIFTATGTKVLSWEGVFAAVRARVTNYTNGSFTAYLVASPT